LRAGLWELRLLLPLPLRLRMYFGNQADCLSDLCPKSKGALGLRWTQSLRGTLPAIGLAGLSGYGPDDGEMA
jgi:hypothetical protein